MIKEYCDICGKEKHTKKYILPAMKRKNITDKQGTVLKKFDVLDACEKDVCDKCVLIVGSFIDGYSRIIQYGYPGFEFDKNGIHVVCTNGEVNKV